MARTQLVFALSLALALSLGAGAARATLVSESSWWHADPTERPFQLGLGFVLHSDLAELAPDATDFTGPLAGVDVRGGYWLLPWLSVDAGATWSEGQDHGLFGDGLSRKWELGASAGATIALPLRITPYGTARLGYHFQQIDWIQDAGLFSDGDALAEGTDDVHALFFRGELGVLWHLTPYASLSLGAYLDVDLLRDVRRATGSTDARAWTGRDESAGVRRLGGELALHVRF